MIEDDGNDRTAYNLYVHAGTAVAMAADTMLVRHPVRFSNFVHYTIVVAVYGVFNWLLSVTDTAKLVYRVLDWDHNPGMSVGIIAGIAFVLGVLIGLLHMMLYCWRMWLFTKVQGDPEQSFNLEEVVVDEEKEQHSKEVAASEDDHVVAPASSPAAVPNGADNPSFVSS